MEFMFKCLLKLARTGPHVVWHHLCMNRDTALDRQEPESESRLGSELGSGGPQPTAPWLWTSDLPFWVSTYLQ